MAVPPPLTPLERIILVVLLFAFIGPLFGTIILALVLVLLNIPISIQSPIRTVSMFPFLLAGGYFVGLIPAILTGLTWGMLGAIRPRAIRNPLLCASFGAAWLIGFLLPAFGLPLDPRTAGMMVFRGVRMGFWAELAFWGGLSAVLTNWVVARILPPPAQRTRRPPRDPDRAALRSVPATPTLADQHETR